MKPSRIIVLNGVSTAGKTSIAKAMQRQARGPLLHVQMDSFLGMMPPRYANHEDAFLFRSIETDGHPEIEIVEGPYGAALMAGLRASVASLADRGMDVIVDEVFLGDAAGAYRDALAGHDLKFVGVRIALEAVEARERARGDRLHGLARWQLPRVHERVAYDLEVDTTHDTAEVCARRIVEAFGL